MREIKFRGWFQGINGAEMWVYGYLVKQTNGNWEITNGETSLTVDNVGQFTGLTDSNASEIYEGDVLGNYRIEYFKGMFVAIKLNEETNENNAYRINWLINTYGAVITGNIHE